jgi:hypothetical protein
VRLVAFCEAPADFRRVSGLVDLVLRETGASWVVDGLDTPEVIRTWVPDGSGRAYFDIHKLDAEYISRLGVRTVRGHFDGRPGGAGSAMARKVFLIARALQKQRPEEPIDAVVLVWDTDEQADQRPAAVELACAQARQWNLFRIACGFPDPESEAWVLAGFDPCDDDEHKRLDELRRELRFSPVDEAVRLRDRNKGEPRDIKRVLEVLTGGDSEREQRCWTEPSLATLRQRGRDIGLAAFLDEVDAVLDPLLEPHHPARPEHSGRAPR